ncbi:coproporphyrinogen III oxidase [filamentous cyanobacterium LEGE 11480]|uniref:Heme chaperone HemW n=1 Tax=Romeriopsis navalis LEGE 11480 TaxID=2777977 RepID=A0A928Z0U7_9CYAN|nr:radical SAM family heme chaperone HemW [Romeriopsis navalis]MBE9028651.1 coproporphyrinogen III oxidase [Romeriopsis navalis LEGE 11480]
MNRPRLSTPAGIIVNDAPRSAYVHIPFCRRRCFYCDFPIYVVGDRGLQNPDHPVPRSITTYLNALQTEIHRTPRQNAQPLETVFFGGGTPSVLTGEQLGRILASLDRQFGLAHDAEISMEIDPGTFDLTGLRAYQQAGINRFSFGTQAFQPELLAGCGRAHTVTDIANSMAMLTQAGIDNYSLDLISGLPNQTLAQWQDSLHQAIAYQPTHISTYDLTIEAGTVFGKRYRPGDQPLPSDDTTAAMYRLAHQVLSEAGYNHYEVSNYAKPGYQCQHNRMYWENRAFYGFGMGATSYLQGHRYPRPRQLQTYIDWVEQFDPQPPASPLAPHDLLLDTLMVGFRLAEGIALPPLQPTFGDRLIQAVWQCLQPYIRTGWLEAVDAANTAQTASAPWQTIERLRLTAPEGFLFSNVLLVKLFDQLDES